MHVLLQEACNGDVQKTKGRGIEHPGDKEINQQWMAAHTLAEEERRKNNWHAHMASEYLKHKINRNDELLVRSASGPGVEQQRLRYSELIHRWSRSTGLGSKVSWKTNNPMCYRRKGGN